MKSPWTIKFLVLGLLPCSLAYPQITSPSGGESLTGGTALKVEWTDSGTPAIADCLNYQLFLYTGDNTSPFQLLQLSAPTAFTTESATTVVIPITEGAETANAYFVGIISVAKTGGTITTFSNRFTLTGMTGSFAAAVSTALLALASTVTAGPSPVNNLVEDAVSSSSYDEYGTAYNLQTGSILYASMPLLPPSSISATATAPQNPTSSVSIATTYLGAGTISTTVTQQATYSFASHANTASAAPNPTDDGSDMAKFLRRWKDDDE